MSSRGDYCMNTDEIMKTLSSASKWNGNVSGVLWKPNIHSSPSMSLSLSSSSVFERIEVKQKKRRFWSNASASAGLRRWSVEPAVQGCDRQRQGAVRDAEARMGRGKGV